MVWLLLFSLSNNYWFLPAGLRLAVLWRLPRRAWPAMAGLEWAGIMALSLWRDDFDTPLALLASATLPWLVYAAVVAGMGTRRDTRMAPLGSQLPRLLACGALAALANSISLLGADLLKTGALASPAQVLFDYGLGDFIGVLVFAATVLAVDEAVRTRQSSWRELLAYGAVLLPPAIVLLVAMLPMQQPQAYALVLSLFPLFWIASRFGWRPAAVCLTLLAAAVHGMENLHLWRAAQLQLLFTASAMAALLLGAASERVVTQSKALMLSLEQLQRRGTDLVDIARRLTSVQERERRSLGGELHDVLGQDLTSIAIRLRVVERTHDNPGLREGLQSISQLVAEAHQHLREVTEYAYPAVLDRFGLQRALAEGPLMELARDAGMDYRCQVQGEIGALSAETATSLYRICQEATSNGVREPRCNLLHINFEVLPASRSRSPALPQLIMSIHDDAGAIAPDATRTGIGLQNIRDRANALGARYRFDPQHGAPRHWLSLPLEPPPIADPAKAV